MSQADQPRNHDATHASARRSPTARWLQGFRDLAIGSKLYLGFGLLVLFTFLIIGLTYLASREAAQTIERTESVQMPVALAASRAQSSLLTMQSAVRGYLVLGDIQYIDDYNKAQETFEDNLEELQRLSTTFVEAEDVEHLQEITTIFEEWAPLPSQLFKLHDNPLVNQPALHIEKEYLRPQSEEISGKLDDLISVLEEPAESASDRTQLNRLIDFRVSFHLMLTNLYAYASTGDLSFKWGYADALTTNSRLLAALESEANRFEPEARLLFDGMSSDRLLFLDLPLDIFDAVEGKRQREDLYLFRTVVAPRAESMLSLLTELTRGQQSQLQQDLEQGRQRLTILQIETLLGGLFALLLGGLLALFFNRHIAGPVGRLNRTAQYIVAGELEAQAVVESDDEIGRLARTFNQMTRQLRDTIDNLERHYQLSQGILTARDLSELLAVVVESGSSSAINRAVLNVFEFNEEASDSDQTSAMVVKANWYSGRGTPPSPTGTRYLRQDGESLQHDSRGGIIELMHSRRPLFFDDLQSDSRADSTTLELAQKLKIRAMVVLPLWQVDRQIGVLLLEGEDAYRFREQEIRPYLSLLSQLTVAIENRRLYEQTQQRAVELARAKEAAESANRAKGDFLARMSHELRTPLNGILGYAQILQRDQGRSESQQNAAHIIHESGEYLLALIEDILDFARIEARRLELFPDYFSFPALLQSIVAIFRVRIQLKEDLLFYFEPSPRLPTQIRADEKRLRQILINLIDNAIKFTPSGQITLRVYLIEDDRTQGRARLGFEVEDSGIGIREDQIQTIFEPFEQGGTSQWTRGGTGLGLAITNQLIERMNGEIHVKSRPGAGSTFIVSLSLPARWIEDEQELWTPSAHQEARLEGGGLFPPGKRRRRAR